MPEGFQKDSNEEVLTWGIIGCGDVVKRKSGPALLQAERSEIKVVMRRNLSKAQKYASEHEISVATDEAGEVIEDPEVDVVYVATPPNSHKKYAIAAAEEGKDVVVEKPMGLAAAEATQMVEACESEGVELFVAYYRRFYPQVQKLQNLLEKGKIGEPVQGYVRISFAPPEDPGWREEPEISGGGWFVDVASHRLDLLTFLLGSVDRAHGVVTSFESGNDLEDTVTLSLKFDSGAQASVQADFYTSRPADELYIHGTEGTLYTDDLTEPKVLLDGMKQEKYEFESLPATHSGLVKHIEKVLLGGVSNRSSGEDGLITEEVLDETIRSRY